MEISSAQYRHIRTKYARRASGAELRGKKDKSHPPLEQNARENDKQEQERRRRRSSAAVAQLAVRQNAKTKALQQSAPQGSQSIK